LDIATKSRYTIFMQDDTTRKQRIETCLRAALAPTVLVVRDVSAQHHGHAGWREGGETHFEVDIGSPQLDGLSRIDTHRRINAALADELATGLHALQIRIIR